jgi:sortase system peptidoglycan-associated protein
MNVRTLPTSALSALALVLGAALALSVAKAQAQELDPATVTRYENIGVISGAAVGAVVGGPPGAVVSAAVGGWLSDKILAGKQNRLLKAHLESTRQELLSLQKANASLQEQVLAQQTRSAANLLATTQDAGVTRACCADSELVLHFRTGSAAIEAHYQSELKAFVGHVQSVPQAVVEMYGYADRRGDNAANLALSQQRLREVEGKLRELGLRNFTYETTAMGEGQPLTATDNFETNFYDRRVVLRVRSGNTELLSSSR